MIVLGHKHFTRSVYSLLVLHYYKTHTYFIPNAELELHSVMVTMSVSLCTQTSSSNCSCLVNTTSRYSPQLFIRFRMLKWIFFRKRKGPHKSERAICIGVRYTPITSDGGFKCILWRTCNSRYISRDGWEYFITDCKI